MRSLRVIFLACNKNSSRFQQDASYIYRCQNLSHGLSTSGCAVQLSHVSNWPWWQSWDVVVLHRPRGGTLDRLAIWLARLQGATLIADFDDLIFDPSMAEFSPGVVNSLISVDSARNNFDRTFSVLDRFDAITVSTEFLKRRVIDVLSLTPVLCSPNAVHHSWLASPFQGLSDVPVISYNPGTRSHDQDFEQVISALAGVMKMRTDVQLRITGPLEYKSTRLPTSRVSRRPRVPFEAFHECYGGAWVNLAPLEASPFNDCKSALKVIEAGWWGVPTVTLNLPDAERFQGAAAWPAQTPQEFGDVVLKAITAIEQGAVDAQAVRDSVLRQADVHVVAAQWLQWVAGLRK